jgi:hypothetical protein
MKNFYNFRENEGSLSCPQEPETGQYFTGCSKANTAFQNLKKEKKISFLPSNKQ